MTKSPDRLKASPHRRMGGRPKRTEVKARQERLLDVATEGFLRDGLSTTIEGIAAAAGVSKRTIYARYPDKRALFSAAISRLISNRAREKFAVDPSLPLAELLARLARIAFESAFSPDMLKLNKLARRDGERFPDLVDIILQEIEVDLAKPLAAHLKSIAELGLIRAVDTAMVARLFLYSVFGEVNGYHFRGLSKPEDAVIDAWVHALVDIYVHALKPAEG